MLNMKRIISILLVFAVLHLGAPPQRQEAQAGGALVIFIIGCVAVGAGITIWVMLKHSAKPGYYEWILEKSSDHVNWTPVATNMLRMYEEQAWDAFEVQRNDASAFYRMRAGKYLGLDNPMPNFVNQVVQVP